MSTKSQARKRILLTGGRAPVTLELARLFHRSGYEVYTAESFPNHLCRFSAKVKRSFPVPPPNQNPEGYRDSLITMMNSAEIDWLIPTCEEIFWIARWKPEIEALCPGKIDCPDFDTLSRFHNKYTFIQRVQAYGFHVPKTFLASSVEELLQYHRELNVPSVMKPVFSRFGTQVKFLPDHMEHAPVGIDISPKKQWVLQRRILGTQYCTYSIIHQGTITAHTTYRMGFNLSGGASISFEAVNHQGTMDFVRRFARAEHFSGQIAFDIIEDCHGDLYPIECNPRATGGVHLLAGNPLFARAFFESTGAPIMPQPGTKRMLFFPMLYSGMLSLSDPNTRKCWWETFHSSKDVIWDHRDPIPFFHQLTIPLSLWRISRKNKLSSLAEASTRDIEWNGEP